MDMEVRVRAVVIIVLLFIEVSEHAGLVLLIIKPSISVSSEAFLSSVLNFILNSLLSLLPLVLVLVLVLPLNLILLLGGLLLLLLASLLHLVIISIGLGSLRSRFLILRLFLFIIVASGGLSLAVTLSGTRSFGVISCLRHIVVVLTDIALGSHFHVLSFSDLTLLFHFLL
jgi:hypothetical protein